MRHGCPVVWWAWSLTVLYGIDTMDEALSMQAPPNDGTLKSLAELTLDGVVQDVGPWTGFD